ncbi:MAG: hypothetical protein NPIRA02_35120 [Nitrospirales bacterium]|nr:MAG: hypothetical protein NPIRA02_35120 [Nitrospirales bacterium]
MTKSKTRSLDEDRKILQTKVQERRTHDQSSQGDRTIRSLRKRLKRIQRKVRGVKAREAKAAAAKTPAAES